MKNKIFALALCLVCIFCFLTFSSSAAGTGSVVKVTAYGANGSDKADDRDAIQRALNQGKDATDKSPLKVEVPKGEYYINRGLIIYSNTTLKLDKDAKIIRNEGYQGTTMLVSDRTHANENDKTGEYKQLKNVSIIGGTWDGNGKKGDEESNLITICHAKNIKIKDTTIKHCVGTHFIELSAVDTAKIENVTFCDFIEIENDDFVNAEAIQLEFAGKENSLPAKPYDGTPCKNITVENCNFKNLRGGVGNHHAEKQSQSIFILNNHFENISYSCINFSNMINAVASGNTATNVCVFLHAFGGSDARIENNTITCNYAMTDMDNSHSTIRIYSSVATIENNHIYGSQKSSIQGSDGSKLKIIKNEIDLSVNRPSQASAVSIIDSQAQISLNTIKKAGQNAIYLSSSSGAGDYSCIDNNIITQSGTNAIHLKQTTGYTTLSNTITDAGVNAIQVDGSANTIKSNQISGKFEAGIRLTGGKNNIIQSNTITKSKQNAITVIDAQGKIISNTITSPSATGIRIVDKSNVTVQSNKITNAGTQGISVASSTVSASGNTISSPKEHGINISDSKATLTSNSVTSPGKSGITATNAGGSAFKSNTIKTTGKNAIGLFSTKGCTIESNTIDTTKNSTNGIYIESSSDVNVKSNTITKASAAGIRIAEKSNATVQSNKITSASTHGISIKDCTVTVNSNTVTGSKNYGIFFDGNTTFTAKSNTISKSGGYAIRVNGKSSGTLSGNNVSSSDISLNTTGKVSIQLKTPAKPTLTLTTSGIKITWGKVSGAAKYRVYYKTGKGSWKKLADTTSTSYTWKRAKSGTKYSFTVRCVSKDGKKTTSAYDTTGKSITYIAAPKVSKVTNEKTGVKITWGKVSGAAKYRVYYKTGKGGWKKLADTTSTSYTWKKAKSGTKYSFTVRCVSKDGKKTTSAYDTTGKSITYIAAPKVSKVTNEKTGVKITWGKVSGAAKYRVYYKTGKGGWKKLADTTSTSYTWKKAKSGTKYSFTVRCVSKDGKKTTSAYDTTGKSITFKKK